MRKRLGETLRVLGACAVTALLIYAPQKLPEYFSRDEYMEFFEIKQSEWTGVLRVWNVYTDGLKLPQKVIDRAKKRFCGGNTGIYVEYATLAENEEEKRRMQSGYTPDIVIYPAGAGAERTPELTFSVSLPENETVKADFEFDIGKDAETGKTAQFCVWVDNSDENRSKYANEFASLIAKTAVDMLK